jgi:glycosyltransferase involved in cell wall biosynthesis
MARIGMNPARHRKTDYQPSEVTVAVLVYIPHLSGYFQHRFEVLKLCLGTLLKHTDVPYDLMVFDNASCEEIKAYLRGLTEQGSIRYLLHSSENIGKLGALRIISGAAPGKVIAYSDDDTFFYPGWLSAHMQLLKSFPHVGMVSGSPERTLFDHGIDSNLRYAGSDPNVTLSSGQTIPEQWELEWATSLGRDVSSYMEEVRKLQDIIIEYDGIRAYATACHNQFIIPKPVALEFLQHQWTGRLMGGMNEFDNAIDAAGYLRLTTIDRTTRLIGNLVSPMMEKEARRFSVQVRTAKLNMARMGRPKLLRNQFVRWFLQGVYNRLFSLLTDQSGGWYIAEDKDEP